MKKTGRFFLFFLVALMLVSTAVPAAASQAVTQGSSTLDGMASMYGEGQLLDTAEAVVLYELGTDTLVYSWNCDQRIDPSGMNKIMTALLALELADIEEIAVVSRDALNSVGIGSVSAGLKVGEEISLKDLLYCMMVGSANDAAAVIAEYIGGSQAGFVDLMNERAEELGCTNTNFLNANGLSHEEQYTTARDLAKITKAALEEPVFVDLFGAVEYTVKATNKSDERRLVTTNHLMSKETVRNQFDERVTGGKTGALSTTNRSLIATAQVGDLCYLSVVMCAHGTVTANGLAVKTFGSFEETRKLLDHGFGGYAPRQILYRDQVMDQFSVVNGQNDVIGHPEKDLTVLLPEDAVPLDVSYRFVMDDQAMEAPLEKGQVIGSIEVWFRGLCVGECDMLAMFAVHQPGVKDIALVPTAADAAKRAWTTWLLIGGILILTVILIWVGVLLIQRKLRLMKVERRHKIIRGEDRRKR